MYTPIIECVCWPIHSNGMRYIFTDGGQADLPYRVVTVRVPSQVATQCKDIAQNFGWQPADLLRTLICIGATLFFLSTESPTHREAASTLLGGLKLLKLSWSFSLHPSERPYAYRIRGRKSTLMTLSLPDSVCDLVAIYADLMKASRNEAYHKCLQQGLLAYLKAQTSILHAERGRYLV